MFLNSILFEPKPKKIPKLVKKKAYKAVDGVFDLHTKKRMTIFDPSFLQREVRERAHSDHHSNLGAAIYNHKSTSSSPNLHRSS